MTKSVAIVTGASQGIDRVTAIRLAGDFTALAARGRDRLRPSAGIFRRWEKRFS